VSTLLLVDIGNTAAKVGVWERSKLREVQILPTQEITRAAVAGVVSRLVDRARRRGLEVALSAVSPQAEAVWLEWCQHHGVPCLTVRGDSPAPLVNRYANQRQLGPDRLATAVGAVQRLGAPVIAASLGTATVVDAVSGKREFLGGAIAAGVETGLRALSQSAAKLLLVSARSPSRVIGRTTREGLRSGAVLGAACLIEGLVQRMRLIVGENAPVALTGGHAELVSPHLRLEHTVSPNLTLDGLAAIWEYHRGKVRCG